MSFPKVSKDPDAILDYGFDWLTAGWLATGETLAASSWIVPTGITKDSDSHTDSVTTVWLSGGTAGTSYDVTNRITTTGGRTDDRSITIKVVER